MPGGGGNFVGSLAVTLLSGGGLTLDLSDFSVETACKRDAAGVVCVICVAIDTTTMREMNGLTNIECIENARYALHMREFFRNAFALDDGKPCAPSPEQRAILERVADEIARRRMTSTAVAFLEMSRPLHTLGSAAVHFMTPIASSLANPIALKHFAEFLEKPGSVDVLANMLEEAEKRLDRGCCEGDAGAEADIAGDAAADDHPRSDGASSSK